MDYKEFLAEHRVGARVTSMSSAFDALVDGSSGKPHEDPTGREDYLLCDLENIEFLNASRRYTSDFARHASASIPFLAEGDCRLGAGILRYTKTICENGNYQVTLQEIAGANGAFSKTIVDLSKCNVSTLTNSATHGNYLEFLKIRPEGSYFWDGPFYEITPEVLNRDSELSIFQNGFDIIYEHIVFQMYSANREQQIEFVSQNLKPNGILLLLEKNNHVDPKEYFRREEKKDGSFKSRYFSDVQLSEKKRTILNEMEKGQVTLGDLAIAMSKGFQFGALIWSSCNFNLVAASNSHYNLERFVNGLTAPCMPMDFCFEQVPQVLFAEELGLKINFRPPITERNPENV